MSATLFVYAKSGYYEGVQIVQNLLLEDEYQRFEIEVPCNESLDSCAEELGYWISEHKYVSKEMAAYLHSIGHIDNVLKDVERVLMDEYAQIVGPYVEGYRLVATFGNGEAIYERV